ncbi:MAG: hypothetical protein ABIH70_04965 [Chloroflexota bacterium]
MALTIQERFLTADISDIPRLEDCNTILERALWILWVAKDKLLIKRLTAEQIASILRDVQEVNIKVTSITQSLNRAGDRIYTNLQSSGVYYEIMKPGKEQLKSLRGEGELEILYFEPEQRYSSKRILANSILNTLDGEIKIVDPYCSERTLDIVKEVKGRPIKFLTRIENITNTNARTKLLRELKDFKSENPNIDFGNYPNTDLHDRYIISPSSVVLLGHSIKDLGAKESFAIMLDEASSKNIYEALNENFDRRWKQSNLL